MFGEHNDLVISRIRRGEVVLVLGAGANAGSTNRYKNPIKFGETLAQSICLEMGDDYNNEPLSEVVSAGDVTIGRDAINALLIREFRYCKPSINLDNLFKYCWNRVYTWNYDDALIESLRKSVQRVYDYNGMSDSVEEIEKHANLQTIFLHGKIDKLDKGIILSKEEYSQQLQSGQHQWYKELASDYKSRLVVFIGSSLQEPILDAEIQRASRPENDLGGYSFVITPDELTPIRKKALLARKIIHAKGKLEDFSEFLITHIGAKLEPKDLIADKKYFSEEKLHLFSHADIESAQYIRPIFPNDLRAKFADLPQYKRQTTARFYLIGFPISWEIASSEIPVRLEQTKELLPALKAAVSSGVSLFATIGHAGSGKSTATMQALLDLAHEGEIDVFELDASVKSVAACLAVLRRVSDKPKAVFLRNLFVFGSQLADVFAEARAARVTFVATARSSEWQEHFRRHFENDAQTFQFQRFKSEDFEPLIDRLKEYVPAPSFVKLSRDKQIEKLKKSKNQLLIALREVTESRNFDDIIIDEFKSLDNCDVQELFILVGLCTLARVGVDPARAAEAYQRKKRSVPFKDALARLEGIVEPAQGGRLFARHEFYVRNILDSVVTIDETITSLQDLLSTFTKYEIPITKHITRTDAALFRFLLNHSFIRERAEKSGARERGIDVYTAFELDFQLDGHFWLQYGLYYQRLNRNLLAMEMFEKSVQAFPGNPFAIHALASERLHQASNRRLFDAETKFLVSRAVEDLEKLEKSNTIYIDHYPLVTLSRHHIDALIKHGRLDEAKSYAREYFERLKVLAKKATAREVMDEQARLLTFITTTTWNSPGN